MRLRRLVVVTLALALASVAFSQQPAKRLITETDIFRFLWVADPQVSPDGKRVAFTRVNVDDKGMGYETSLWTVAADGGSAPTRLSSGTHDARARWSPDGRQLAFLRTPMKDGKPQPPQIYILPTNGGGEAWQLTDVPQGAGSPVWSPDGRRIAFLCEANEKDLEKQKREKAFRQRVQDEKKKEESKPSDSTGKAAKNNSKTEDAAKDAPDSERESDVRTITRAIYRFNGPGYLDPKHITHLWVVDVPPAPAEEPVPARQLTSGKYDEENPRWSPDGTLIYVTTTHIDEPYYELPQTDLYAVPAAGGAMQKIAALDMGLDTYSISPDGKSIAFTASTTKPVRSYTQPDLWTLELTPGGRLTNLTAGFDSDVGDGVFGDNRAPRGNAPSAPIWTPDGKAIIELVGKEGRANLMRFPLDGSEPTPVTQGERAVTDYSAGPYGAIAVILSSPTVIGDIYLLDGAEPRQLTRFNQPLFSQLNLTEPEEIWYPSFDGRKIQAWVQKPPDFDPKKKYPLILNIHGGPHAAYGYVFDHEFQWMAARGYVVLYPNPRGSTSYGQEFGNIIQYHYPGDDYKDLMGGVDELIQRGYIDPAKLGVTGGSGGGVLTNWTVTHTGRFRAAVSQRDIADWANWWYTADFTLFQPNWFRQPPFLDPADYANRSAITWVTNIRTPIMFVLGEVDWRTPPTAGGEVLFRALKYLKRPTAMVRFPNESHELSRSGQPWHRVERLQSIVGWMDKYLLGKDVPQFKDVTGEDVTPPAPPTKPVKPKRKKKG